jgi:TonB-dependent starch-binding outer membrane protein SusC
MEKKLDFRWLRVLPLIAALMLLSFSVGAQTITGNVTDENGEGLVGVNILVKGSTVGTISDMNGDFQLNAPEGSTTLIFSSIGYQPQEVEIGGKTVIDLQMSVDETGLEEVVVVGYGTAKKSDLSGASVTVSGEQINSTVSTSVDQALQGHIAGVTVTQTSGAPGSSVSMRIRGTSTLNSDAEPLYVIDGTPITNNNINNYDIGLGSLGGGGRSPISSISGINPSDIESVEVLKDASATAIYGSRGANGVILITTKRGKPGEAKFTYDGYYGIQNAYKRHDMLNLQEYAQYYNDMVRAGYANEREDFVNPSDLSTGTDWQGALFRVAPMQSHQITALGGTEKSRYSVSAGYFKQDGVILGSSFERYTARINQDSELKKWLTLSTSISYSNVKEQLGNFDQEGYIDQVLRQPPDIPVRNFDGTFASGIGENIRVNPIALLLITPNELKRNNLTGNLGFDIKPVNYLTLHTEFGGNMNFNNALSYSPMYDFGSPQARKADNSLSRTKSRNALYQVNTYLTFAKKFGKHDVTAMVGHEASEWSWENLSGQVTNLTTNEVLSLSLGDSKSYKASDNLTKGSLESYFTRATYNFDNKYYLTATLRRDGSSNFGPNNRWAIFPAVAASWRISNESFMQSVPFISNLKLRAGWGKTGNQNIAGFAYSVSMATLPTDLGIGMRPNNYENPNVRWEESEQINLGIDATLFDKRIDLTVDIYDKRSKKMLMEFPFPAYMGGVGNGAFKLNNPVGNFGEISNKGIEIALTAHVLNLNGFKWDVEGTFSMNRNELVDLGLENSTLDGKVQFESTLVSRVENGQEIGSFFGWKVAGIFKDKEDILNSPRQYQLDDDGNPVLSRLSSVWIGDLKFEDINHDGVIDEKDRTYLGSPQPLSTSSIRNVFSYKGIELSVFFTASYGNKVYNFTRQGRVGTSTGLENMKWLSQNQLATVLNHADFEPINPSKPYVDDPDGTAFMDDLDNVRLSNPGTDMPRITTNDPNNNQRASDRYIEDGSFIKLQNITLSYNLPQSIVKRAKLAGVKVYTSIQNIYTWTNYSGYDPEVGQDAWVRNVYGVDNNRYPSPRIFTFGLNLQF